LRTSSREQLIVFVHHWQRPGVPLEDADVDHFTIDMPQFLSIQEMPDGGRVVASRGQSGLDGVLQLRMAVRLRKLEQIDHLFRATLLAMSFYERLPDLIEAGWPQTGFPFLFQRLGSGQWAWFTRQHIQIMLEIEDLLQASVTALVPSDTAASVP
jgi:hypothetical protein